MKIRLVAACALTVALGAAGCATNNVPVAAASTTTPSPGPTTVYVVPSPAASPSPTLAAQPTTVPVPVPAPYYVPQYPAAPAPGVGNWYPINSEGSVINVRVNPSTLSGVIGTVTQDSYVHIQCTQYGDAVAGPFGTTTLWDYIDSPYSGYVSDEWVNTASGAPVVGSC